MSAAITRHRTGALALLTLDLVSVALVFNAVAWLRLREVMIQGDAVVWPLAVPLALVVTVFHLLDSYQLRTDMMSLDYTSQHLIALVVAMLGTLLVTFVVLPAGYPLQQSRAVVALSFLALMPVTLVYRRALYAWARRAQLRRSVIFVADGLSCAAFAQECTKRGFNQPVIYSTMDAEVESTSFEGVLAQLEADALEVEAIVLNEGEHVLDPSLSRRLVELYFRGVPTYTLELFHQVYWRTIPLHDLDQQWLFQEGFQMARDPLFERAKRLSDIVVSLVGLAVAVPVFALVSLAITAESGGPALFRQTRIGKNRVAFTMFKFRTMRPAAVHVPPEQRVTRVGRFLRACRIDELPQLLNVLRGEMSLIGPRAEWDRLVQRYEDEIPCYHFRHLVRPGITGWAQVNYPHGATFEDVTRKLEYDLYYIRHFSLLVDASIVLKTIHVMLFGKGR